MRPKDFFEHKVTRDFFIEKTTSAMGECLNNFCDKFPGYNKNAVLTSYFLTSEIEESFYNKARKQVDDVYDYKGRELIKDLRFEYLENFFAEEIKELSSIRREWFDFVTKMKSEENLSLDDFSQELQEKVELFTNKINIFFNKTTVKAGLILRGGYQDNDWEKLKGTSFEKLDDPDKKN